MPIVYKAKTKEAYNIKVLSELLANNLKTGCFSVTDTGVSLRMVDTHRPYKTLIDIDLSSENFSLYRFKAAERMDLGLNLNHFHKMLKSVKKKDSIELYIDDDDVTDLYLKTIPKENTRITTSSIKIQNIQNLDIDLPTGYGKPVIVSSSEFQKMAKDMLSIGTTIKVTARNFHIEFACNAGGVIKRSVQLGEIEDSDDESDQEPGPVYQQEFSIEQLTRITKIAGLSTTMQIFPTVGLPLLFRSSVGTLGRASIYIKSLEQVEKESCIMGEDSDGDSD
jgi:proliferating cell nuclear antigen PCNA